MGAVRWTATLLGKCVLRRARQIFARRILCAGVGTIDWGRKVVVVGGSSKVGVLACVCFRALV
jgi:hypothetical protein